MASTKKQEKKAKSAVAKLKNKQGLACDSCNTLCKNKYNLKKHYGKCVMRRTCQWCNIEFKNRGNLVTHVYHVHGDKSLKEERCTYKCDVCLTRFRDSTCLKYHVRRCHFNLQAKVPLFELKKDNDVWYENVLNTDLIAELQKINNAKLEIQKCDNDSAKVEESSVEITLTDVYCCKQRKEKIYCTICNIYMLKRTYKKHVDEKHSDVAKYTCNNCNATFKRSYFFVRHVCNKERKRRKTQITIAKLESLNPIPV